MDAERDRRLIEAGEPPWGEVLPGTDEVTYYVAEGTPDGTVLFRSVAMRGALYVERYRGNVGWKVDSGPFTYWNKEPLAREIAGREATRWMAALDAEASGT